MLHLWQAMVVQALAASMASMFTPAPEPSVLLTRCEGKSEWGNVFLFRRSLLYFCFNGNGKTLAGETKLKHLFSLSSTLAVASAAVMAGDWNRILLGTRRFWRKLCRTWFSRNHQRLGSSAYWSRSHCLDLISSDIIRWLAASTISGFDWDYVPAPFFQWFSIQWQ